MTDPAFEILDALNAPLLTADVSWASCLPERIKNIIPQARLMALTKQEKMATYPEIVFYLMSAAFNAPMDRDWVEIYTHVCCKVCQDWFNEDQWDKVQAPRELSSYLNGELKNLRIHIYEKRRKILKSRLKTEKHEKV